MSTSFEKVMQNRRELVDKIIANMEKGYILAPDMWNVPRPYNPTTGAKYRGGNQLRLSSAALKSGYDDNRWLTFKQAEKIGAKVRKGESGVFCEKWIFDKLVQKENELTGETETVRVRLDKPIANYFYVFNASQIDGMPPKPELHKLSNEELLRQADDFLMSSECPIFEEVGQDNAYYSPSNDEIHLPKRDYFIDEVSFFDVAAHEMGHSTGHPSRLNRDMKNLFGSEKYALEELRAELGSYFVGVDLQLPMNQVHFQNHTNYLSSWIKALKGDPNELFRAMSDADAISQRLIGNYGICKEIKASISENESPEQLFKRMGAAKLNNNQIKNIINAVNVSDKYKSDLFSVLNNNQTKVFVQQNSPSSYRETKIKRQRVQNENRHGSYDISQLKAIPIDEVCEAYGIEVKQKGNSLWCSIRDEQIPSCKLYTHTNTFCDFGNANFGGDTIDLTKFVFNLPTAGAIEKLAQTFGIQPLNFRRSANGKAELELSDWQYAKIGVYGDLATKNLDFDIEKYGLESTKKFAEKYYLTMNELKKEYPKVYAGIMRSRALPFVREQANDYYTSLYLHDHLCKELNFDVTQQTKTLEQFSDDVKRLNSTEKILRQALIGTDIKHKPRSYDAVSDIIAIRAGKITPDIGNTPYSEVKSSEAVLGKTPKYMEISLESYQKNFDINKIPHAAFLKKDKVNLCFSEKYVPFVENLLSESQSQINTVHAGRR